MVKPVLTTLLMLEIPVAPVSKNCTSSPGPGMPPSQLPERDQLLLPAPGPFQMMAAEAAWAATRPRAMNANLRRECRVFFISPCVAGQVDSRLVIGYVLMVTAY